MFKAIAKLLGLDGPAVRRIAPSPKLLLTKSCLDAVQAGLAPDIQRGHEGIVYLLGRTDGTVTLGVSVFRPQARTTQGSFDVSTAAMAQCVSQASEYELQVIGQIHTHPGQAYHSDGDVEGARIRYAGYVSLVIPHYGRRLPSLAGLAAYIWTAAGKWADLAAADIVVIPGAGPWTASSGSTSATAGRSGTAIVL
jgi:proteasome lid subunit RPN8/RPN11